ncbi:MAG: AAA family ATPase, partial [Parachlamydiaceae bacterium]
MNKPLPIGMSDFKKLIDHGYVYVDKTLLIQEIVEKAAEVTLIPRLRRFGKTLNLSMLHYFFEKTKEDTSYLFKDLKIWKDEKCRKLQGQFPVIFITLKDLKHASWEETFDALKELIADEFGRHQYILEGEILSSAEKEEFVKIIHKKGEKSLVEKSLLRLSKWLHRYHKTRVILLIDEYDAPAHAAYIGNYYDTLIHFLRNWLSAGLKDNAYLERAVLTGILRIAKESIFSGLNNISTFTILHDSFSDKFGLLESEVEQLLKDYNLSQNLPDFRK